MNKTDFIKQYQQHSTNVSFTVRRFDQGHYVAMPCNCEEPDCAGWAVVVNTQDMLAIHIDQTLMNLGHDSRLFDSDALLR